MLIYPSIKYSILSAGVILFGVTAVVIVVLSLVTKPIPKDELCGLTWATIGDKKQAKAVEPQFNEAIDERKFLVLSDSSYLEGQN